MKVKYKDKVPDPKNLYSGPEMGWPDGEWRGRVRGFKDAVVVKSRDSFVILAHGQIPFLDNPQQSAFQHVSHGGDTVDVRRVNIDLEISYKE